MINPNKCIVEKSGINFLGYNVSEYGIKPPKEKVDTIVAYPKSATAKQLRQFLGMVNFYRRFIPGIATMQAPLNDLLKVNIKGSAKLSWTLETQQAFQFCKEGLVQATTLVHIQQSARRHRTPTKEDCNSRNKHDIILRCFRTSR